MRLRWLSLRPSKRGAFARGLKRHRSRGGSAPWLGFSRQSSDSALRSLGDDHLRRSRPALSATHSASRRAKRGHESTATGEDIDILAEGKKPPSYIKNAWPTSPPTPKPHQAETSPPHEAPTSLSLDDGRIPFPAHSGPAAPSAGQPFRRARILTFKDGSKQLELLYGRACPRACILIKQGLQAGWAPHDRAYTELPDETIVVTGGRYGDGRAGRIKIRLEGTSRAAVIASARALYGRSSRAHRWLFQAKRGRRRGSPARERSHGGARRGVIGPGLAKRSPCFDRLFL